MKPTLPLKKLSLAVSALVASGFHPIGLAQSADATQEYSAPQRLYVEELTVYGMRENRVSTGATKLPLELKETPQSISIIDQFAMEDYNTTGSNAALKLGTGINVDQYETHRATYNSRGFEIQLTQIDGLGMTNSWGTVEGQLDTFLFEKIELIRGANGLLTGVGNASGTVNYVRKRPTNEDTGRVVLGGGSDEYFRVAADYNKVLTDDGKWAARAVVAYEDKGSHIRALHDKRTSVYAVVDGQIGENGVLTFGGNYMESEQDSPMWGSLTLFYPDGSMAEFDDSASTSQDWTYWDEEANSFFVEYVHQLGSDWEAKLTYNGSRASDETKLFYAYTFFNYLEFDNTGLYSWPYSGRSTTDDDLLDANLSGSFTAFGNEHRLIAGVSSSKQETSGDTREYDRLTYQGVALPAFPYAGNAEPEPQWYAWEPSRAGEQKLTRFYVASQLSFTDELKLILGANSFKLEREGASIYGSVVDQTEYPDTEETSPYVGVTYDFTDNITAYASYSDIFQNQDQTDINGDYLDPVKGVNMEVGVKAEWLDQRLLTTLAVFSAEQEGIATYGGVTSSGQFWYMPADVESEGVEFEATGRLSDNSILVLGVTYLDLAGPDGEDIWEWVPDTTVNVRFDTRIPALPQLKLGISGRWQSDIVGSYARQDAYFHADAFASYEINEDAIVRLNVTNLFDEKYVEGLAYGAIYGQPLSGTVSLQYNF